MSSLRSTYKQILSDYSSDKSTFLKCLVARYLNPSFSVLFSYRVGYYLYHSKNRFFRFRLAHPIGVVIGVDVIVGNNVTTFQIVTLGSSGKVGEEKSYPTIEDNVIIYADSIVVGKDRIGENSVIGSKTLVNIDVPPNSLAVGIPCKIINKK